MRSPTPGSSPHVKESGRPARPLGIANFKFFFSRRSKSRVLSCPPAADVGGADLFP